MPHHMNEQMRRCVEECQRCQESCLESIPHCLEKGGAHAAPDHIGLLSACAEICDTSARFMLLGSKHHSQTCGVCAEVCEACASDCAKFTDDEMMQRCAETCRACARSCREMAAAHA